MDKFIKDLSYKAGKIALKYFNNSHVVQRKKHQNDVVTEADLAIEKMLIKEIKKKYPSHGIVSEERGDYGNGAEYVWYIDPIDGTLNFSKGIPVFCVIIGVARKEEVISGSIYHPVTNRLYFGKKGKGAYMNGKRIHCSKKRTLKHTIGASGMIYYTKEKIGLLKTIVKIAEKEKLSMAGIGSGGVSVSYTAEGAYDWFMSGMGSTAGVWDYAGGSVLLKEAGCNVGNRQGKPWTIKDNTCITANPVLYKELLKIVKESE